MKELRFKILESSDFEIGDFKLIEFRGNPQNPKKWFKSWNVYLFFFVLFFSTISFSQVAKVSIIKTSNGFQLTKNGKPYYIKGAGAKII